jgi:hypothetical protein
MGHSHHPPSENARPGTAEPADDGSDMASDAGERRPGVLLFVMGSAVLLSLGGAGLVYLPQWLEPAPSFREAPEMAAPALPAPLRILPPALVAEAVPAMPPAIAPRPFPLTQEQQEVAALQAEIARLLAVADQLDRELVLLEGSTGTAAAAAEAEADLAGLPAEEAGMEMAAALPPPQEEAAHAPAAA